ncbi:MAG: hypothetical protein H6Q68_1976 [Firmicutes bacterium]|nr:hypothetical protein [Bacillota bacterium]
MFDVGLKGISPERFNPSVLGYDGQIEVKQLSEEHAVAQVKNGADSVRDKGFILYPATAVQPLIYTIISM